MYNCELYSVQKENSDAVYFDQNVDNIASMLYDKGIRVIYKTDISYDSKKVAKALTATTESDESLDYFIFANALDTTDSSSFKNLFYDFIKASERRINSDNSSKEQAKIKISSIGDLGNGYKGYCFRVFDKHYVVLPRAELAGVELVDLIDSAIDKADSVFLDTQKTDTNGLAYVGAKKPEKKEGFFSSFIPKKTDSTSTKVRKWVVIVAIIAFLVAVGYLVNDLIIQPHLNTQINSEIQNIAYKTDTENSDEPQLSAQNWDALKKINKEIVGWITIDGTRIDYPVLEHKGDDASDQYYLNHTYKKDYSVYGSIFFDYRSTDSVKSKNVILHGHNMQDGSMFKALTDYGDLKGDLNFYKKHPIVKFNCPEEDNQWKIISVFKTSTLYEHGEFFNYMQGEFLSDAEFMNFIYNVRIRSLINAPVMVNEKDQILTLSTCSYEFSNWRTVVVARKLRPGEKAEVNTEIATLNSNPVFPEVYYESRGGTRPTVLTFKTAYEKGLINWYDGEGKLEGSEDLTATIAANPTEPPTTKDGSRSSTPAPDSVTFFTVKFMNYDGSEFQSYTVKQGDPVPMPSSAPTMPSDEYYNYTFSGWKTQGLDLNNVQYSMDIAPDFKATLKQ